MTSSLYSIAKHTLLPFIYTVQTKNAFTYLLRDPATASLLMLPSGGSRDQLRPHILNIQNQFKCKLTHTFTNSKGQIEDGPVLGEQLVTAEKQGDLRPFLVGELSICYIKAAGYRPDYSLVAVTHSSPSSTKFSVLFPGTLISECSIDLDQEVKASLYCETLNKLKYFPNQTLLFPEKRADLEDLQFAKALGGNPYLDEKINSLRRKEKNAESTLMPTSMLEQKMLNPFLSPEKYSSLLKATDRVGCFELLRRMRRQWKK